MLNTRVSETTKFAPFELWMGHIPRSHQPPRPSALPRLAWHEARFEEIRKQAQSTILRAQALYLKTRRHVLYKKGDKVWLESKNLKMTHPSTKLRALRYGPFEITEIIGSTTYRLKLPPQWKIHNAFHASLLMPYKVTKEHGENFPQQLPEIVDVEEEWVVEKVLDSRRVGRKRRLQYLLKWEGYPEADNSWEYKEDVFSPDLIAEFHRKHPTAIKRVVIRSMSTAPTSTPTVTPPTARSSSPSLTSSRLNQYDTIARAGAHNWRDSSSSISVDVYNTWPLDPPAGRYTPYPDSPSPAKHPPTPSHARDPTSTTPSSSAQIDSLAGQLQQLRMSELPADASPRQEEVPIPPGSPPPQPIRPRGEDTDKGKGRELPEVAALSPPRGMTEQELQEAQERRSEGDGPTTPEIEPTAYIDLTKEASEVSKDGGHPGLPWVPNGLGRLFLEVRNNKGVFVPARYIRTEVVGGDPMVFGTLGVGYYDYAAPAHATPFTGPLEVEVEEGNYVEFSSGQYFNRAMIRGVEMLGDDGLLAELYHIRGQEERERSVIREEQEL